LLLSNIYYDHHKYTKSEGANGVTVYRRRTDNTMARRKNTKGQTMIYKTYNKPILQY